MTDVTLFLAKTIFITILLALTLFISVYFYKNDFAIESFAIFQSTLGALVLSAFLGIKAVWIDAPK